MCVWFFLENALIFNTQSHFQYSQFHSVPTPEAGTDTLSKNWLKPEVRIMCKKYFDILIEMLNYVI